MSEARWLDIIRSYTGYYEDVAVGIGDDAAVVKPPPGYELVVCADTLVEGIHFFADTDPAAIGHKALAVNLSDLAAMGAMPQWVTLCISHSGLSDTWLHSFMDGFSQLAHRNLVALIGGDLTGGHLTITVQAMGVVPAGQRLLRSGAEPGDTIWVSGQPGQAAIELARRKQQKIAAAGNALDWPEPQVLLGQSLLSVATSAIDISDGLALDLSRVASSSNVKAVLDPLAFVLPDAHDSGMTPLDAVLYGGDDYQLLFTTDLHSGKEVRRIASELDISVLPVGYIETGTGLWQESNGKHEPLQPKGYDHFTQTSS